MIFFTKTSVLIVQWNSRITNYISLWVGNFFSVVNKQQLQKNAPRLKLVVINLDFNRPKYTISLKLHSEEQQQQQKNSDEWESR